MAEQIHDSGSGYYNPQARRFQPTLQIPMLESPALRGFVEDEMGRIKKDTETVQSNVSKLRNLKSRDKALQLELSPGNLGRFENIRKRYGIEDDFANVRAEQFANPMFLDSTENKIDNLLKDPEVKQLLGSESYLDAVEQKAFQLGNKTLREKAFEDIARARESGAEDMLSLSINDYQYVDPNKFVLEFSKDLPEERFTRDKDGFRYTYDRISDEGLKTLEKRMEFKYENDPQFRNSFDAEFGSNYDSVADYVDFLHEQGNFIEQYGKRKKIDSESGEGQKLFKDIRKNLTGVQRDIFDNYTVAVGKSLTSPAPDGLSEAIRQITASGEEYGAEGLVNAVNDLLNPSERSKGESRTEELEEGQWMNEEGNVLDLEKVQDYEDDLDMSSSPFYSGNYDEHFVEGTKQSLKKGMKTDYKGKVDEEGNLLTSNARWVYEEYLGQSQDWWGNVEQLKSMVDDRDDIEFVKASKGIPAHFKIKGQEIKNNTPQQSPSSENGSTDEGNMYSYGLELTPIDPKEYPTVGGNKFNTPVSKPLLNKVKPLLEEHGMVITDGRDGKHKDKRQQNGVSLDVDFSTGSANPEDIKEVIDEGNKKGLNFVFEVKTEKEKEALLEAVPELEGNLRVVPSASGDHFSVYEKPFDAVYGSSGKVKDGSLSAKTNNPLNLTDTGFGSMHYKVAETKDNKKVPFYRRPEHGLAVGYAKINNALNNTSSEDGPYWADMTLEQFSNEFAVADTDVGNLVDWLNKIVEEEYNDSSKPFSKNTPLFKAVIGVGDSIAVGLDGFMKAMLGKELSPGDYKQLVENYGIFDNINENNYERYLKGVEQDEAEPDTLEANSNKGQNPAYNLPKDVEVGNVTTFPTNRGEARTGVPKGYSSSKANNPFNVRPDSNSNTFNVYETMEQGFKDGIKLLDRYYEGKNTTLRDNKERYFDSKGEPVTLKELVYTWSPPENMAKELGKGETGNTQEAVDNYLRSVAKNLGVSEDTKLQDIDKEALALEMVKVECPKCYKELVKEADPAEENTATQSIPAEPDSAGLRQGLDELFGL